MSHRIPLLDIYLKDCTCVPTDISKTVSRRIISNRKNMETPRYPLISVSLCPFFYKDIGFEAHPNPVQYHLKLTNYICKGPIPKLRSYSEVWGGYEFWGGHNLTKNHILIVA